MRNLDIYSGPRRVPVNPFLAQLFVNLMVAFAGTLKDVDPNLPLRCDWHPLDCRLWVGQQEVHLNPFTRDLLADLLGVVCGRLHGVEEDSPIRIEVGDPTAAESGSATIRES